MWNPCAISTYCSFKSIANIQTKVPGWQRWKVQERTGYPFDPVQETYCMQIQLIYSGDFLHYLLETNLSHAFTFNQTVYGSVFFHKLPSKFVQRSSQAYRARSLRPDRSYAIQVQIPTFGQNPAKNPSDPYNV